MRSGTFKLLSIIAFTSFLFPIVALVGTFVRLGNAGYVELISALAVACLSFLLANIFNSGNKGLATITVLVLSGAAAAIMLFGLKLGFLVVVACFILDFIVGYTGYKAFSREVDKTLSKKKIITMALIALGIAGFTYFSKDFSSMMNQMTVAFFVGLVASLFVLNRSLLESLYRKKSSEATDVSKLVQKYNAFIIGGFAIVFVLIFLVRGFIAWLLNCGLAYAGLGFVGMFQNANKDNFGGAVEQTQQINNFQLPPDLRPEKQPWADQLNNIMLIVALVILAIVLIIVLVKLIRFAPRGFQIFMQKLKDFFSKMMGLNQVGVRVSAGDFVDEVENIEKGDIEDERRLKMLQNQKKVRAIKDPVERMRAFYAYFMNTLKKNNVPLYVSDTSYQINDKSHLVCDMDDITSKVTELYNQVRYNDSIPDDKTLETVDRYMSDITKGCKALKIEDEDKKKKKGKK